jgi:hypothetical protein
MPEPNTAPGQATKRRERTSSQAERCAASDGTRRPHESGAKASTGVGSEKCNQGRLVGAAAAAPQQPAARLHLLHVELLEHRRDACLNERVDSPLEVVLAFGRSLDRRCDAFLDELIDPPVEVVLANGRPLRTQAWEVRAKPRRGELEQALGSLEVLERVLAEVETSAPSGSSDGSSARVDSQIKTWLPCAAAAMRAPRTTSSPR